MFRLKYFWPYLLFFFSIAILVWLNVDAINKHVAQNRAFAHTINIAGRQRMLSERLVKDCYKLYLGTDTRELILKNVELWNTVHFNLQQNHLLSDLKTPNFPGMDSLYQLLNPVEQELYSDIRLSMESGLTAERLQRIANHQERFIPLMDALVYEIDKQATIDIGNIKNKQGWLAIISGLVLVLEMGLFIYPYHKRLVRAFKQLKEQREEIDAQAEQLHKLNETQDLIIKGITAGVWEWNVQTGEESWSLRFFELLGYTPGEIPASFDTFLNKLLHPEDKERVSKAVDNHLKLQVPYTENIRLLCKDGEYRWFEAAGQALWDAHGKPLRMAGSVIDIHQNIIYRNKLEYNEFMLEEAGKMAQLGSWDFEVPNGPMNWSANMYDIHEAPYGDKSILLQPSLERYPVEFHELITHSLDNAIKKGIPFDVELHLITAKGNRKWIRSIGEPVKDADGKVVQLRGVYQDINDRKLKELELVKIKEELENTSRTKDKLFSIVAHDLRGPLAGLSALMYLQGSELISQEEYKEMTAQVKVNLDNMLGTMDNLLQWAQSQLKGIVHNPGRMLVSDCIKDAMNLYSNALALKHITVNHDADNEVFAYADHDQVFLIIRNLLNNAVKFTPDNGKIDIYTTIDGEDVKVHIKDSGLGMSHGTLQTILDNKYLFTTQGTMGEKGSGLGLNLCFEMATRNGGRIEIQSEPGNGSTFTLVLKAG